MDFSLDEAQHELDEVAKEIQRTQWLYTQVAWNPEYVEIPRALLPDFPLGAATGFFEPLRLFFCWADYLGALYLGNGLRGQNPERIKAWLAFMWQDENLAAKVCDGYRNHLVHARAPGHHSISFGEPVEHLIELSNGVVRLDVPKLLEETLAAVRRYAVSLPRDGTGPGSLDAFNRGRAQMA